MSENKHTAGSIEALNDAFDSLSKTALRIKSERDELLEQSKRVVGFLRTFWNASGDMDRAITDLEAAIAKAEGRT